MVPCGVREKDMADPSKIVLAYSVIEDTETGQGSIFKAIHSFKRSRS
jgi:hypothetical protein